MLLHAVSVSTLQVNQTEQATVAALVPNKNKRDVSTCVFVLVLIVSYRTEL